MVDILSINARKYFCVKQIGLIIKELRKSKRISQTKLGQLIGVSTQSVSEWETGKARPDISRLQLIAKELGTSVDILIQTTSQRQSQSNGTKKLILDISRIKQLPFLSVQSQTGITDGALDEWQSTGLNEYYQLQLPHVELDEARHAVIEVDGDSMEPEIRNRALVLGERISQESVKEESNAVYAIQYGRRFVIKRIKSNDITEKGRLVLHSDNDRYGPMTIDATDIKCMWKVLRIVDSLVY